MKHYITFSVNSVRTKERKDQKSFSIKIFGSFKLYNNASFPINFNIYIGFQSKNIWVVVRKKSIKHFFFLVDNYWIRWIASFFLVVVVVVYKYESIFVFLSHHQKKKFRVVKLNRSHFRRRFWRKFIIIYFKAGKRQQQQQKKTIKLQ